MSDLVASGFLTVVAGCSLRPDELASRRAAHAARASGLRQPNVARPEPRLPPLTALPLLVRGDTTPARVRDSPGRATRQVT